MVLLLMRCFFVFVCLCPSGLHSTPNFVWKSIRAWNNGAWGEFCYDLTTYNPTCGWQIILKSSVLLSRVEVWDSFYSTSDNFVFTLTNLSFSGDFKDRNECTTMNFIGQFGNTVPDVVLTWLCVCDATTNGQCKNIYSPSTAGDIGTASNHPLLGTFHAATATMTAASGLCYVGGHSVVLSEDTHLLDCAAMCADLSKCTGVNYRSQVKECDLVYQAVDTNPALMRPVDGCIFWKVFHT